MTKIEQRVKELVEEKIADRPDLFIVSIQMLSNGKLSVLLDGDSGISIDDCVKISRHVGFHLEEEEVISHAYILEVSSPGAESPFINERQYLKNIGRQVEVILQDSRILTGELLSYTENSLHIAAVVPTKGKKEIKGRKPATEEVEVSLADIITTKVIISFK